MLSITTLNKKLLYNFSKTVQDKRQIVALKTDQDSCVSH